MLVNITHDRKGICKFPYKLWESFMTTTRVGLFHLEKVLITESGAHWKSNWANFWQIFCGGPNQLVNISRENFN